MLVTTTYTIGSPGTGTFPPTGITPDNLLSPQITVSLTGGQGGIPPQLGGGVTPGARLTGKFPASILPVNYHLGSDADGPNAGAGYSGGGGGGGWQFSSSVSALFWGGGGGGSTCMISTDGVTVYAEAGGGDGVSYTYGGGTTVPSLYPGGSGGGAASNSPDNGTGAGLGAGSGGSAGGSGGNGSNGGAGAAGVGGPGSNGVSASYQLSGAASGSGTYLVLGAGACGWDTSNMVGVVYGRGPNSGGSISFTYHVDVAPDTPALISPIATLEPYVDAFHEGITFAGTYNASDPDTGALGAVASSWMANGGIPQISCSTLARPSGSLQPRALALETVRASRSIFRLES